MLRKRVISAVLVLVMALAMMPISVRAASGPSISLDQTTFAPGETVRVSVSGIPNNFNGRVRLTRADAPHVAGISSLIVRPATTVLEFTSLLYDGEYEMRLYNSSSVNENAFVMAVPFIVDGSSLSLEFGSVFAPGETIRVTSVDIPHNLNNGRLRLVRAGAPHSSGIWSPILRRGTNVHEFSGMLYDGEYELRMYRNSSTNENSFIRAFPFTICSSSISITLDRTNYASGETIRITPVGIPSNMNNARVRLVRAGAPHSSGIWSGTVRANTTVLEASRRLDDGNYEMRLYRNSSTNENSFIMAVPFTVGAATPVATPRPTPPPENGIYVDGVRLQLDVPPVLRGGRILAPIRPIGEALDALFDWDPGTQTATMFRGDTTVIMQIGNPEARVIVSGVETTHVLDAPPILEGGRTMVPLRFVGEVFGAQVRWDPPNAIITTN